MDTCIKDDIPAEIMPPLTRWDELCSTVSIVAEIASALDPTGCDVYLGLTRLFMSLMKSGLSVAIKS